MVGWLTI